MQPHHERNSIDEVVDALRNAGCRPERRGRDWMACCPVHDDRTPSLSVRERNGRVLIHCHGAGCGAGFVQVMRALGFMGGGPSTPPRPRRGPREPDPAPEPFNLSSHCRTLDPIPSPEDDPLHAANCWADGNGIMDLHQSWPRTLRWNEGWPPGAAGRIVAPLARLDQFMPFGAVARRHIAGIETLSIDEDGEPFEDRDGLTKRTHGQAQGRGVLIGTPTPKGRLAIVEGIKDALAIWWYRGVPAFACCGTAYSEELARSIKRVLDAGDILDELPDDVVVRIEELPRDKQDHVWKAAHLAPDWHVNAASWGRSVWWNERDEMLPDIVELWPDHDVSDAGQGAAEREFIAVMGNKAGVYRDRVRVMDYDHGSDPAEWVQYERAHDQHGAM